jgi:hypothetical protein
MNPLTKVKVLRFAEYVVDFIAAILGLYATYLLIVKLFLPLFSFQSSSSSRPIIFDISALIQVILFIFAAVIISRTGKYLADERLQISNNLDNEIIGIINVYGDISLQELSEKFKMKLEEAEKWIAKLNAKKKFDGIIDKSTMRVYSRPLGQENKFSPELSSTKILESKSERLKRLEELFKEGKISEQVYTQLKKEYESE